MNFFDLYSENNKEALFWLERAASNDEPEALYQLGVYYEEGVEADLAKAINYFQRAAELNHADAALELSYIYDEVSLLSKMMIKRYSSLKRLQN